MEFELGRTYSGYRILDVVRRSRSAVQYRVENTLAERVESMRTLTGAACDDPDAAERFLREVRIRARLSHPHILTFYTAVPIEGRMAMTTELPDSLSLAERLHAGPLPWRDCMDIARQVLEALGCVHQQHFVHCDVTPENIQFGQGGFCKLTDFSLARPVDPAFNPDAGVVVGTPRYISPEQVKGECQLDQRSDLYSLGVVLYEMLCGRAPFESRSQFELMMAHVNQVPAPPSIINTRVPTTLDGLVLKALAKDAGDRYVSASAFTGAIDEAVRALEAEEAARPAATVAGDPCQNAVAVEAMPAPVAEPATWELALREPAAVEIPDAAAPASGLGVAAVPEAEVVDSVRAESPETTVPDSAIVTVESIARAGVPVLTKTVEVVEAVSVENVSVSLTEEVEGAVVEEVESIGITETTAAVVVEEMAGETDCSADSVEVVVENACSTQAEVAAVEELESVGITETTAAIVVEEMAGETACSTDSVEVVVESACFTEAREVVAVEEVALETACSTEPLEVVVESACVIGAVEPAMTEDVVVETSSVTEAVAAVVAEEIAGETAGPAVPAEVIVETACVTEAVAAVVVEGYEEVETAPITEAVEPTAGEESASGITEAVEVASEGATTAGESVVEAPAHSLQNQLWAAAEMVAAAACEDSRPQPPVTAAPPPEVEPSPVPVPAPTAPKAIDESMPPFMTNLRDVPNNLQWAFFGGTAAFLGVVLAAIWFAVGR